MAFVLTIFDNTYAENGKTFSPVRFCKTSTGRDRDWRRLILENVCSFPMISYPPLLASRGKYLCQKVTEQVLYYVWRDKKIARAV